MSSIAKKLAKEAAEKAAKEAAQKAAKEAAQKAAKEAAQKIAKETAEKAAKEAAQKIAKETAEKLAKEAAEKAAKKSAQKAAKSSLKKGVKKATKFVAKNPKKVAGGLLAAGLATDAGLNSLKKNNAELVITSIENTDEGNLRIIIDNERDIEINSDDTIIIKGSNSVPSIDGTYNKSIIIDRNGIEFPNLQVNINGDAGVMTFDTSFLKELTDTTGDTIGTVAETAVNEVFPVIADVTGSILEKALEAAGVDPKYIEYAKKFAKYVPYIIVFIILLWVWSYIRGFFRLISGGNIISGGMCAAYLDKSIIIDKHNK